MEIRNIHFWHIVGTYAFDIECPVVSLYPLWRELSYACYIIIWQREKNMYIYANTTSINFSWLTVASVEHNTLLHTT